MHNYCLVCGKRFDYPDDKPRLHIVFKMSPICDDCVVNGYKLVPKEEPAR